MDYLILLVLLKSPILVVMFLKWNKIKSRISNLIHKEKKELLDI